MNTKFRELLKTYQTLTLIGGIFGIVIVPIILFAIAGMTAFFSAFDETNSVNPEELGEMTAYSIIISVIVSVVAIIISFTWKKTKTVGYVLLGLSVIMLIATNISGIITWVLFLVGGISAIKLNEEITDGKHVKKLDVSSLDILKERYAKGEITKEEFDKIKEDLK